MKNTKKADLSDWVALAINAVYTYHVFGSDSAYGTDAQRDFVRVFTAGILVLSIALAIMLTDDSIVRAKQRPLWFRRMGTVLAIMQLLAFVMGAHFWLFVMRVVGIGVLWSRFKLAYGRTEEAANTSRDP